MNLTSEDPADATAAISNPRWSLAGTRPSHLAVRLIAGALGAGALGGVATACVSLLYLSALSPTARIVAIGLPLVLVAMIGWRLAVVTDHGSPPSARWFVRVTAAAFVLTAVAQVLWKPGNIEKSDLADIALLVMMMLFGAAYGLMPAAAAAAVLVPTALLLRAARAPLSLRSAQVGVTAVAMLVTGAFDLWATPELHNPILTGTVTAFAGTGAVLTARWCLVDRRA